MEKQVLTASINLTKIAKDHLFKTDNGAIYLNLKLILKGELGQYGDIGFIVQSPLKEKNKDENGDYVKLEILGNIKPMPEKVSQEITDDDELGF